MDSPQCRRGPGNETTSASGLPRMIIIDKPTGKYVETLISTPALPPSLDVKKQSEARISVAGYGGTCDVIPLGDPNSVSGMPDGSHNPNAAVEEEKKPYKERHARGRSSCPPAPPSTSASGSTHEEVGSCKRWDATRARRARFPDRGRAAFETVLEPSRVPLLRKPFSFGRVLPA